MHLNNSSWIIIRDSCPVSERQTKPPPPLFTPVPFVQPAILPANRAQKLSLRKTLPM
jgi:hypothetical protein